MRTFTFPIQKGSFGQPLKHQPATDLRGARPTQETIHHRQARDLLDEITPDLKKFLAAHAERLTVALRRELETSGEQARKQEDERYRSRQGEVSSLIAENTLAKLGREVVKLRAERQQGFLFEAAARLDALDRSIEEKQEEIARRTRHYEEVRAQLERERERILKHLLPKRHALSGVAQVFPGAIEVRLPGGVP